jgi:hypothetical protein
MNKPYNIQNTNICNGIFHISFFKALLINNGETTHGSDLTGADLVWGWEKQKQKTECQHGPILDDMAHLLRKLQIVKFSKHNAINYRPISLTCILSKIMEHIIASNLMKHLESNNILYDLQHGFRSSRSCETQLISLFYVGLYFEVVWLPLIH